MRNRLLTILIMLLLCGMVCGAFVLPPILEQSFAIMDRECTYTLPGFEPSIAAGYGKWTRTKAPEWLPTERDPLRMMFTYRNDCNIARCAAVLRGGQWQVEAGYPVRSIIPCRGN
jgi:hypothetical protein